MALVLLNQQSPNEGLIPLDYFEGYVTASSGRKFPMPAVVMVTKYIKKKRKHIPFSRKNVFLRDQMTCQYCGLYDISSKNLTYDHVIPRAIWRNRGYIGTPTTWTNIVTCCEPCNKKKADKTPKQSGLTLLRAPKEPNPHQYILGLSPWCKVPPQWELYLTPLYKHLRRKES